MNRDLELKHLRSVVVLAESLHFGRAAAALGCAQPALSQQIARLEAQLGFQLFRRTTRTVQLTAAGADFLGSVQRAWTELSKGIQAGREIAAGSTGSLSVGYVATAMVSFLPSLLREFRALYPNVRLALRELSTDTQIEALLASTLDVAIVSGGPPGAALETLALHRDSLMALVPSSHRLSSGRQYVDVSALEDERFILFPRRQAAGLHDQILGLCRSRGFQPAISQEAQSWHMIASLVSVGLGVSIVPSAVRLYRVPKVRFLKLRPATSVTNWLCTTARPQSTPTEHFVSVAARAGSR